MLALTYHGSKDVRVDRHPDPILQEPDDIILHRLALRDATEGYRMFDEKVDNCTKVILRP